MITYIVSGHMRTGTSAMMGALIAGGMDAHFNEEHRQGSLARWADDEYAPNEFYYEPAGDEFQDPVFPRQHQGKLLKVLHGGLSRMATTIDGYRIVFMRRDPEEIRQSHNGFFHRGEAPAWITGGGYEPRMTQAVELARNRKDVLSVTELRYAEDLIEQPLATFTALRELGWPIKDVDSAADTIKPELYRYRLEDLVVGI